MQNAVMAAVEERVQAQSNQKHWVGKLKEEREKAEGAQSRADLVQQEFEVRLPVCLSVAFC